MSERKSKRKHSTAHHEDEDHHADGGHAEPTPAKRAKQLETTDADHSFDQWKHFFYVEAPKEWNPAADGREGALSVFLAGGISNCPDWQTDVVAQVAPKCERLIVLNPRRDNWDASDSQGAGKQIQWEFDHLRRASAVLFWFPEETLCPITLFELGQWSALAAISGKKIFVGTHPNYKRRLDVEVQLRLILPSVAVVDNLEALSAQVVAWYRENSSKSGDCSVQ